MTRTHVLAALLVLVLAAPAAAQITGGGCTMSQTQITFTFFGTVIELPVFLTLSCKETTWTVFVRNSSRGLQVGPAWLQRKPGENAVLVLNAANVAENITLYHDGSTRLNDTEFANSGNAIPRLNATDLDAGGMLVTLTGESVPTVAAELRSRGFAWYCTWGLTQSVSRRGMEMAIWGIWDTGNYDYIIEYTFRDDGQISFRAGATGWNNAKDTPPDMAHTHELLWRVDLELGSGVDNTARLWTHQETSLAAVDSEVLFNNGVEGAMDLDDLRFATLLIEDDSPTTRNAHNHRIGYELHPVRDGTGRHFGAGEQWTQHDTWVTRFSAAEAPLAFSIQPQWVGPDVYLVGNSSNGYGIANQESIATEDLVLWHMSTAHHEPHDEDQAGGDPSFGYKGITLIHWSGFDLVPHNLFDANPLGAPHRQICDGPP